jgi:O-antigen/teichoic acid export membrane protein
LIEARDVLTVLTTADFLPGVILIPWIALGILFAQLVGIYNYNLHAHSKGGMLIISLVIGASVNILLNIVFVPLYGYVAAAISTLVAYLVIFFINRAFSSQYLAIPWDFRFLGKVLISCLFMAFVCVQIRDYLPWNDVVRLPIVTGSGLLLYFLSIKPLDLLNKEERIYVLSAVRSVFYIRPRTAKE